MHIRHCVSCFVLRPVESDHECLLLKRGQLEDYPGTWQLLAGQIEHGESTRQAVIRLLRQVTQLEALELYALNKIAVSFLPRYDATVQSTVFVAMVDPGSEVKLVGRHAEYRWVKLSELDRELLFTVDQESLAELRRDVMGNAPVKSHLHIPLD